MKRSVLLVVTLAIIAVLLSGCGTKVTKKPNFIITDLVWEDPTPYFGLYGKLRGIAENIGNAPADYLEIRVKLIQNGVTVATGWTNETHIAIGERRAFEIIILDYPDGLFTHEISWSLSLL